MPRYIALWKGLVLLTACSVLRAQAPPDQSPAQILQTVERLIAQNRQLEKQNQELMKEVTALRQVLEGRTATAQGSPATPDAPETSAPETNNPAASGGTTANRDNPADADA